MDTASGSSRLSLLYRLDDACNYRENFNSVLLWPCSLGNFPPLMILGSWNEICESSSSRCWLVLKALQIIIKGNTLYFNKETLSDKVTVS